MDIDSLGDCGQPALGAATMEAEPSSGSAESNGEDNVTPSSKSLNRVLRLRLRLVIAIVAAVVLSVGASVLIASNHQKKVDQLLMVNGFLSMDEKQLREVVIAKGLTVYWAGPQNGGRYVLNASNPLQISLQYLPRGKGITDAGGVYRALETFVQKDAFAVVQKGGTSENGVGFINADGNSVYYNKLDPTSVYIGVKGQDLQVQIFDPKPDQSLGLAMSQGTISKIR